MQACMYVATLLITCLLISFLLLACYNMLFAYMYIERNQHVLTPSHSH